MACGIGLSCKTQELYLLVFCVRYMDLFMYYISLYNTFMKLFFISSPSLRHRHSLSDRLALPLVHRHSAHPLGRVCTLDRSRPHYRRRRVHLHHHRNLLVPRHLASGLLHIRWFLARRPLLRLHSSRGRPRRVLARVQPIGDGYRSRRDHAGTRPYPIFGLVARHGWDEPQRRCAVPLAGRGFGLYNWAN